MLKINQVIIVEGKYDKIKLRSFIDATIITTDGFRISKDKDKINMVRNLAKTRGVIILTDSDIAGFKIRNFISGILPQEKIINVYIPQIVGKEKRKLAPSKENMLGVEGIEKEIIINCLRQAGVFKEENKLGTDGEKITKQDFYDDGLIGTENSRLRRRWIKNKLGLPKYLSTKALLEVINKLLSKDEYNNLIEDLYNLF